MFKEEMVAPCGFDCNICSQALIEKNPCADVTEKEKRYTTAYPHRESPLENLRMIREKGMNAFLEHERQQWACLGCGQPFSVHDRNCPHCGRRIKE